MSKTMICVTLDHELVHKLRERGEISSTINMLLKKHLFGSNTKEGIKKLIDDKNEGLRKLGADISELKKKLLEKPKLIAREV